MFHPTNLLGKDKPRWPISNTLETKTVPDAIRSGYGLLAAWLIGLTRRAGRRLFALNDAEARWHRWQVTETLGGLGRQYRDPRFGSLPTDATLRRDDIPDSGAGPGRGGCSLSGGEGLWRSAARGGRTTPA